MSNSPAHKAKRAERAKQCHAELRITKQKCNKKKREAKKAGNPSN